MNITDFRKAHDQLFDCLSKSEQLKNQSIRDTINAHADTYSQSGTFTASDVVTLLKNQNISNPDYISYLNSLSSILENEQYPEISEKVKKITEHMKKSKDIPEDMVSGVHYALKEIESYKGNDLKLHTAYLKKMLGNNEDKGFVSGALQTIEFFNSTYKAPVTSRSNNMSTKLGMPKKFVDFLGKHENLFNSLSETDRHIFKPFKNRLNNYIEKLCRAGGNIENISVCDTITSLLYQSRNDPEYSRYLKLVDNILENEQYPEVSENKLQIITHMRESSKIPEEAKDGVQFALEKIEAYKGNALNKYISVMMIDLDEMKSEKSKDFISGATQALKFFNQQFKFPTQQKSVSIEHTMS
ncbi:hypothetical protein [Vibrio parahaemolyticus]|uniref:hypothetical protein n=1 Tax=Vibrio TaxID=662 RepID=UPI002112CD69|nr:hypothetical protein [Vibrio parahaemolyticus]